MSRERTGSCARGWTRIPHSTGKGGLRTLTRSLAAGLGRHGITVNDVVPGIVDTVRDDETHPAARFGAEWARARHPLRRLVRMDEVAFAVAFLCAERSGAITGAAIHVNGGANMRG